MEEVEERQPPEVLVSDSDNATQVRPDDAPSGKRDKVRRWRAYNTGLWNGPKRENKEMMHQQDDLQLYDAISSSLGLTDGQQSRGRHILKHIEPDEFTSPGIDVSGVIFAICVVVANSDVHDGSRYWPHPSAEDNDSLFEDMADELDLSLSQQMSLVKRIQSEVSV